MTLMEKLRKSALESTEFRKHDMSFFRKEERHRWTAYCLNCGAIVTLLGHPLPNQIDIGGEAVAINCKNTGRPT